VSPAAARSGEAELSTDRDTAMAREALRLEREAAVRYTSHPAASSDPRLVTYWESLRRNEAEHRRLLEAWLRAHGADPDAGDAAGEPGSRPTGEEGGAGRHPLAAPTSEGRGHTGDLAALRADYEFEDEAVAVYGRFAYQAGDRELRELFKELARGESGHRNGLRRTIGMVEDPATPVLLFCPLCGWEIGFGPQPAEGMEGRCAMCAGRFALRLDERGDWTLERLAP
jgi:rubrerythrin